MDIFCIRKIFNSSICATRTCWLLASPGSLLKYFIFDIGLMVGLMTGLMTGVLKLNVKDAICLFLSDEEVEIITSWRMCDIITADTD